MLSEHLLYQIAEVTVVQTMVFFWKEKGKESIKKLGQNAQVRVCMYLCYLLLAEFRGSTLVPTNPP